MREKDGKKRVLLLVGSPKATQSTSASLGAYLLKFLEAKGFGTNTIMVNQSLRSSEGLEKLIAAVNGADIVVLAFPLYIDSLPSGVIRVMELIAENRRVKDIRKGQRFAAVVNSGFPEAQHNDIALAICRRFASESGFRWAGGLALGGGEAIEGEDLDKSGGRARFARKALGLAAEAIAEDREISEEAIKLMARPFVPSLIYTLIGGMGWKRRARENKAIAKIHARPYEE
jgi:multimeric flavodoxin WrbA